MCFIGKGIPQSVRVVVWHTLQEAQALTKEDPKSGWFSFVFLCSLLGFWWMFLDFLSLNVV